MPDVLRYAAFTSGPEGGNPAGVVLDAQGLEASAMLAIAAEVGYSETAFLVGDGPRRFRVRYFAPQLEVPFCGHATIAAAVAVAERAGVGPLTFDTPAGGIAIATEAGAAGPVATLTSVPTTARPATPEELTPALAALRWDPSDLASEPAPHVAFAGATHLVLAARTRERLAALDYDVEALRAHMTAHDWVTVDLIWRESRTVVHARNPFPVGGVYEDPATGAAAAALGGLLRDLALIDVPSTFTIHQGDDMGRPSVLAVAVGDQDRRVRVSGGAVAL
jgi:PhzF family phenazine biosynthesis protein